MFFDCVSGLRASRLCSFTMFIFCLGAQRGSFAGACLHWVVGCLGTRHGGLTNELVSVFVGATRSCCVSMPAFASLAALACLPRWLDIHALCYCAQVSRDHVARKRGGSCKEYGAAVIAGWSCSRPWQHPCAWLVWSILAGVEHYIRGQCCVDLRSGLIVARAGRATQWFACLRVSWRLLACVASHVPLCLLALVLALLPVSTFSALTASGVHCLLVTPVLCDHGRLGT